VRTPDARLVWYASIGSRSKTSIAALGVMEGYTGYLVHDDYAGWYQFDAQLQGVQQCAQHLIRHAKGMLKLHPTQQQWAAHVITVLREAAAADTDATTDGREQLDPQLPTDLQRRYDDAVGWGTITNHHRDGARGNHPVNGHRRCTSVSELNSSSGRVSLAHSRAWSRTVWSGSRASVIQMSYAVAGRARKMSCR
jgi:transposase